MTGLPIRPFLVQTALYSTPKPNEQPKGITMTTKTADNTSLEIKRFINAPRDRVYAAWTDPVQLKEWWGPESVRTRNITANVRVGGVYRWDLINQDGEEMTVHGEYRELVPNKKVVFTWQWDDDEAWE